MNKRFLILLVFLSGFSFGQENLISLHYFYKDQMLANKGSKPINTGGFYPATEKDYNLMSLINDSSDQYYKATDIIFKKHLIQSRGEDYFIQITPMVNISRGSDRNDTLERSLFQNTRGVHVECDLFDKFSFSTAFYENQSRNTIYESNYYSSVGELYPSGNKYTPQNAVIPGAARTKPFKDDAFDYAFAVGYFVYRPFNSLSIRMGNNQQFIGDGYRSVLLSDNSIYAPYFRVDWQFHPKFKFTYYRSRLMNLLRKPASGSAESYYDPAALSVNYLSYIPNEKISISLFEGTKWNMGDSVVSKNPHFLYFNPIPFAGPVALNTNEVSSVIGLNASYQLFDKHRVYGQFGITDFDGNKLAAQLGYRVYELFGLNDLMLQLEYNYASSEMYETSNPRLNYSHYNLPLAHTKGNGFGELLFRASYEWNRIYAYNSFSYIQTKDRNDRSLLSIYDDLELTSETIMFNTFELGYRVNRMVNLCVFGRYTYRSTTQENVPTTSLVEIGLSTDLINHYRDF